MDLQLEPEELLLAQLVRIAIRDAQQGKDVRLSEEARQWLWETVPTIAQRAGCARCRNGAVSDTVSQVVGILPVK